MWASSLVSGCTRADLGTHWRLLSWLVLAREAWGVGMFSSTSESGLLPKISKLVRTQRGRGKTTLKKKRRGE